VRKDKFEEEQSLATDNTESERVREGERERKNIYFLCAHKRIFDNN
jgi:hypothetical protein